MDADDWIELFLTGKGKVSLEALLAKSVDLAQLRAITIRHGLKPKGFRVERASAVQLAKLLAARFLLDQKLRVELGSALVPEPTRVSRPVPPPDAAKVAGLESEISKLRESVARQEQSAVKARKSRDDAILRRDAAERDYTELEARCSDLERQLGRARRKIAALDAAPPPEPARDDRAELEQRLAEATSRESDGRRRIAELVSHVRGLEAAVAELEMMLPRGKRERRRQLRRSQEGTPASSFVPGFSDEFWRSLAALDSEAVTRVWAAIARLVLHGFDYPSLHAKPLKGLAGLWSIRAADDLRIYLVRHGESVTFDAVKTREEQETFLKKRRDR